jgi:hypothetical protein
MVLFFAGIVQGYFLISYFLITDIDDSIDESLGYYKIISQRDPILGELVSFYREGLAINETMTLLPCDFELNSRNKTPVARVDYFQQLTLANEKSYNQLRKAIPDILAGSGALIEQIEGADICNLSGVQSKK